jgi:hypothetical protein
VTAFNNWTMASSHEMIEAVTDADVSFAVGFDAPLAWYDASPLNAQEGEIGDICNQIPTNIPGPHNLSPGWTVQAEWSNVASRCQGWGSQTNTSVKPYTTPCLSTKSCSGKSCGSDGCYGFCAPAVEPVGSCGACKSCVNGACSPITNAPDPSHCAGLYACDATGACKQKNGSSCTSDTLFFTSMTTNHSTPTDKYLYWTFASSSYTLQAGDRVQYDLYLPQNLPFIGGVVLLLGSGTSLTYNYLGPDQNGVSGDVAFTDLSPRAMGQWYHRELPPIPDLVGKVLTGFAVVNEHDGQSVRGDAYLDNVAVVDASGNVVVTAYQSGGPSANQALFSSGYTVPPTYSPFVDLSLAAGPGLPDASRCDSGFCAVGYCCNAACIGCGVCSSTPGTCTPFSQGNTGMPSCAPFVCDGTNTSCPTSCTANSSCVAGDFCCLSGMPCFSTPANQNVCLPLTANGGGCSAGGQCLSGQCVDSFCCQAASCGTCQACNGSGGTCVAILNADETDSSCPPATMTCDGAGMCVAKLPVGASCSGNHSCLSGFCVGGVCCGSACGACGSCATGSCVNSPGGSPSPCSGNLECSGTSPTCPASCASDAGCAYGFHCAGGACVPPGATGQGTPAFTDSFTGANVSPANSYSGDSFFAIGNQLVGINYGNGAPLPGSPFIAGGVIEHFPEIAQLLDTKYYVFAAADNGFLYKVDVTTSQAVAHADLSCACANNALHGSPALQINQYANAAYQAAVGKDLVFVVTDCSSTSGNQVLALDAATLGPQGACNLATSTVWRFNPGTMSYGSEGCAIDYAQNLLYCGTDQPSAGAQDTVWALSTLDGTRRWSRNISSPTLGGVRNRPQPGVGTRLYVAGMDGALHVLDTTSGADLVPVVALGAPVSNNLWVEFRGAYANYVFVVTDDGLLHVLKDGGAQVTSLATLSFAPAHAVSPVAVDPSSGHAYLGLDDGSVRQIDLTTLAQDRMYAAANANLPAPSNLVTEPSFVMEGNALSLVISSAGSYGTVTKKFAVPFP